jgi:parallel beta-helix repeat protein
MKKSVSIILILISFIALGTVFFVLFDPQPRSISGQVTINSDGSISPQTTQIKKTGNTYTLTSDLNTTQIHLKKSNMVFDGNGHILGNGKVITIFIGTYNSGVTNVTIQNFFMGTISVKNSADITIQNNTLIGRYSIFEQTNGVSISHCHSVRIIGNIINGTMCGINLMDSKDNLIVGNTVYAETGWTWNNYPAAIMIDVYYGEVDSYSSGSSNNLIYGNAFMSSGNLTELYGDSSNSWDNGKIGNYWGDYLSKYPNAVEVDGSGIGNTPYVINANNIDRYPLMSQADIVIPVPTTSPTSTTTLFPTPTIPVPEFSWLTILPLLLFIPIVLIIIRKRVHSGNSNTP